MTAKITTSLTNVFAKYINGETTIFGLNDSFSYLEKVINVIVNKIIERGYTMSQMKLQRIENIGDAVEVFNNNVSVINEYLISISQLISSDYLISKEILSTMRIDYINIDTTGAVRVQEDSITVELGNGQVVLIKEGEITSELGQESLSIVHA